MAIGGTCDVRFRQQTNWDFGWQVVEGVGAWTGTRLGKRGAGYPGAGAAGGRSDGGRGGSCGGGAGLRFDPCAEVSNAVDRAGCPWAIRRGGNDHGTDRAPSGWVLACGREASVRV